MATISCPRLSSLLQFSWFRGLLFGSIGGLALTLTPVSAQPEPAPPPARPGEPLPILPVKEPRPIKDVTSVFENFSASDAAFQVILGQSRILTVKEKVKAPALIAVGDPSVIDFTILDPKDPRQIRIVGQRIGTTDLSIITADNQMFTFEVSVVADLDPLRAKLRELYPDAQLKLSQIRHQLVVEGQARDTAQVARILETVRAYQRSIRATEARKIKGTSRVAPPVGPPREGAPAVAPIEPSTVDITVELPAETLVNLIRVPGPQQVLLKVRVAELNRTAMRQIGVDFLGIDRGSGTIFGSQIGGAGVSASTAALDRSFSGQATNTLSSSTTLFGIFQSANFDVMLSALRRNSILKVLAEPNVVALNGHKARFNAGGTFPVPVAQTSGGGVATVTVQYQPFGVTLDFIPQVLDGDVIRLDVHPIVSSLDFAIGTVLVPGGTPVPGLDSREVQTTVELKEGQTLAIGGLLQLTMDGSTARIPGLGDLPILGTFFRNTTGERIEKELIVLITPYLVDPMNPDQVPPVPGDEVKAPNDLELYFLGRLESRTGRDFRATVEYDDAMHVLRHYLKLEKDHVCGPHGFSE